MTLEEKIEAQEKKLKEMKAKQREKERAIAKKNREKLEKIRTENQQLFAEILLKYFDCDITNMTKEQIEQFADEISWSHKAYTIIDENFNHELRNWGEAKIRKAFTM